MTNRPPMTEAELQYLRDLVDYTPEVQARWDEEAKELALKVKQDKQSDIARRAASSDTEK